MCPFQYRTIIFISGLILGWSSIYIGEAQILFCTCFQEEDIHEIQELLDDENPRAEVSVRSWYYLSHSFFLILFYSHGIDFAGYTFCMLIGYDIFKISYLANIYQIGILSISGGLLSIGTKRTISKSWNNFHADGLTACNKDPIAAPLPSATYFQTSNWGPHNAFCSKVRLCKH